jgi:hypothetical protein
VVEYKPVAEGGERDESNVGSGGGFVGRGRIICKYHWDSGERVSPSLCAPSGWITAWDRDEVLVEASKKSSDPRRLDDARIVVDSSSDVLSIHTQYGGTDAEHPASVNYRIMVPRTANLENVRLINGGLLISGLAGPVKASSVNGSIRAVKLQGQTDLSTVNGQLEAGFERVGSGKPITLSSVNGPIRVWLPCNAAASVDADNRSGGIESEFGHPWRGTGGHRLRTNVNHGGTPIHVHNVNGGITIRRAWRS